ncbi:MAG: flagella basal body P-ring formation protein FlgA [Polyangiales bacterium]
MLATYLPLMAAMPVAAEDRITLAEVMPALTDTPLGAVEVAAAPPAGTSLTVTRSDVLRALTQAGVESAVKATDIPKRTSIRRDAVALTREELTEHARDAIAEATAPCELREARYPSEVRVNAGPREYQAEFPSLRTGSVTGAVLVTSGGRVTRVPVITNLSCPPPEVRSGVQLTAVAVVGNVRASAPAEARQPGRRGDIIRIVNKATGANLRGRIIDAQTVEVVP